MRVLRVGPPSGRTGRQRVAFDDGVTLRLRSEDVEALGLVPGAELDDDAVNGLQRRAQSAAALEAALRLLAVRLRSRREVADRLRRRGIPPDVVDAVIGRLEGEGLVDDVRFTQMWVAARAAVRPSGTVRLRHELQRKGIPSEIIEQVLRVNLGESEERASAIAVARDRVRRYRREPREVASRRLTGVLRRRGFSSTAVAAALREVFGPPPAME